MLNSLHGQQKDFNMNEKNIYKILNSLKKQQEMQQMQRPMNFEQFMDRFPQNQRNMHMPGMPGGPGQGFHYQQPQQHRQGNGYSAIWDKFRQEHNVPPPNNNEFRNGRFFGGSKLNIRD